MTPDTISAAKVRFPERDDTPLPRPPAHPPSTFNPAAFSKHVRVSVANGGCAGASKWTGETLHALLADEDIRHSCLVICEAIANNRLPEVSRALNLQKILLAFRRDQGKSDRLIGVGEIFYRSTSGFVMKLVRPELRKILESQGQYGCGASGGAELAHHTIQSSLETFGPNSAAVILDEKDAFPNANRRQMLQECFKHEKLKPMWDTASFPYGNTDATMVMMRGGITADTVKSENGTIIGDGLGTAMYCLYAQPIINEINKGLDVQQASVSDDSTTVCRNWQDAITVLERAIRHPNKNLNMHRDKTYVLWPRPSLPPRPLVEACKRLGVGLKLRHAKILGGVIGILGSIVDSYRPLLDAITHPQMPKQIATKILTVCANTRINYQLRIHPPQLTQEQAKKFDTEVQQAFASIHGLKHTDLHDDDDDQQEFLKQCELDLPVSAGGLGLRKAAHYATTAYFSAAVSAGQSNPDRYDTDRTQDVSTLPPFLRRLYHCWHELVEAGIQTTDSIPFDSKDKPSKRPLLPRHPSDLIAFYELALDDKYYKLQRILSKGLQGQREECGRRFRTSETT